MLDSDFSLSKELLADILRNEDPVCCRGHFLRPGFARQARLCAKHVLKPVLFTNHLNNVLIEKLVFVFFRVDVFGHNARFFCQLENICCCELTNLVEDRGKVFVASRDLVVLLKATFLQNAEERIRLVNWLSTAV